MSAFDSFVYIRPTLSILTTTRSDPRLIKALQSVEALNQFIPCEHIIQEAGTTSQECLIHINNSNICVYNAALDAGIYYGMNKCLDRAKGIYSMILNSDDILDPFCLNRFSAIVSGLDVDVYLFDILLGKPGLNRLYSRLLAARLGQVNPAFGMGYAHGGFVSKTEILKQHRFDPKYGLEADYAQQLSILSDDSITRKVINMPIQIFDSSGASSHRGYFSRHNPHLSHIRILSASSLPHRMKLLAISLRLFILVAVFPSHFLAYLRIALINKN